MPILPRNSNLKNRRMRIYHELNLEIRFFRSLPCLAPFAPRGVMASELGRRCQKIWERLLFLSPLQLTHNEKRVSGTEVCPVENVPRFMARLPNAVPFHKAK